MSTHDTPTITQFTDPMCTWCWGSEPIRQRLRTTFGDQVEFRFVLGGLVEDFETFYDAANDISEPSDVAPHWEEASVQHGMPVDTAIFETDPAQSTYPASKAVAAARILDRDRSQQYLRRIRAAYATEVRNVNRRDEQAEIAAEVGLDVEAFTTVLDDGRARQAFEADLERTAKAGIRSFPTYRIDGPDGVERAPGFQPFEQLASLLERVAPALERRSPPPIEQFVDASGPVATQEVAEVYDLDRGKAVQTLESLVDEGALARERRGNGYFWAGRTDGDA